MKSALVLLVPLVVAFAGAVHAAPPGKCRNETLRGSYVLTASGFTRPQGSAPGTPWTPKAIVEVITFDGGGNASSPFVTLANPFGDTGNPVQPSGGGATGQYMVNDDCTGWIQFQDANNVRWSFVADPGDVLWMIQVNPAQNVFQGSARPLR